VPGRLTRPPYITALGRILGNRAGGGANHSWFFFDRIVGVGCYPFRTGTLPSHTPTHRATAHSTSDPTHATTNTVMAMLR
jgi:hypothetical protein